MKQSPAIKWHDFYGWVAPRGASWVGARGVIYQTVEVMDDGILANLPWSELEDRETGMIMAD